MSAELVDRLISTVARWSGASTSLTAARLDAEVHELREKVLGRMVVEPREGEDPRDALYARHPALAGLVRAAQVVASASTPTALEEAVRKLRAAGRAWDNRNGRP